VAQLYREFDPNDILDKLRTKTVALNDYEMINDNLARIVVSYTGDWPKEEFLQQITAMFDSHAVPVRDSFKKLTDNAVVGFVFATPDVRPFEDDEVKKYRVVAGNILMDQEDSTTWELKQGASGKYLCRHGSEDLSVLAQGMARKLPTRPRMGNIALTAGVAVKEFIAYVDPDEGEVQYGYAVERDNDTIAVLSATTQQTVEISEKLVVHATHLMGQDEKMNNMELAGNSDKTSMEQYYRKLYSYAPEYVSEIIKMINEHAFA
jgi:hypothetical protein